MAGCRKMANVGRGVDEPEVACEEMARVRAVVLSAHIERLEPIEHRSGN